VSGRTAREWTGLVVAFIFAGVVAGFCVAVLAAFLMLPGWAIGLVVLATLGAIAYPIFRPPPPRKAGRKDASTPADPVDGSSAASLGMSTSVVPTPSLKGTAMNDAPLVGIIMGSASDMPVMEECTKALDSFGVPYELLVASAHRQPDKVHEWASGLAARGVRVVIAAAGKAAHLGGVVAAYTPLPVITVPMKTSDLGGLDSLLSMVQMPSGVPVACVAINGAKNAAILATQVLGTSIPQYRDAIERMKSDLAQ
jgi:5-(carboxyamino)imidazole ribonucleotide mutase